MLFFLENLENTAVVLVKTILKKSPEDFIKASSQQTVKLLYKIDDNGTSKRKR